MKSVVALMASATLFVGCADRVLSGRQVDEALLSFVFPDGVRGGVGRIQGTAAHIVSGNRSYLLLHLQACGLPDARFSEIQVSHRQAIVGTSTSRDEEIVACLKSRIPSHFNVYDDQGDERFRKFWTSPPASAASEDS